MPKPRAKGLFWLRNRNLFEDAKAEKGHRLLLGANFVQGGIPEVQDRRELPIKGICLVQLHPMVKASTMSSGSMESSGGHSVGPRRLQQLPVCCPLQELLEYMRKLEARLEKVADEKWGEWGEDAATEDEEATAGLSLSLICDTSSPCPLFEEAA